MKIHLAIEILGSDKVITAEQAAKAWELEVPADAVIRYSEDTLRQRAEQNRSGKTDWRLIYINGLSLWQQREKRGVDTNKQPCFYYQDWWIEVYEEFWVRDEPQGGYYLMNLNAQFYNMSWDDQEKEIAALGKEYERCHEAVFSEAVFTVFIVCDGERTAKNWMHWGRSVSYDRLIVIVGHFASEGFDVENSYRKSSRVRIGVVVSQKFDF